MLFGGCQGSFAQKWGIMRVIVDRFQLDSIFSLNAQRKDRGEKKTAPLQSARDLFLLPEWSSFFFCNQRKNRNKKKSSFWHKLAYKGDERRVRQTNGVELLPCNVHNSVLCFGLSSAGE